MLTLNYLPLPAHLKEKKFNLSQFSVMGLCYFFKNNPFYKCNFDKLLTRNNMKADDKEILKKEMQYLLSSKRIFNKIFYFNELYKIFQWTFSIITEKYLFHYDAAPKIFFPNVIDSSAP